MKSRLKNIFLCFALLISFSASGQSFSKQQIRNFTMEHGLSNNRVYCVFKDSYGFTWFGTQDGLNRFDGHNFLVYKHDPYDSSSISAGNVYCITQDKQGRLWLAIDGGGINIINPLTGKIKKVFQKPDLIYDRAGYVKDIFIDSHEQAWISTWGGLFSYDIKKERTSSYKQNEFFQQSLTSNDIKKVIEDKSGLLWIATSYGLNSYDSKSGKFRQYLHAETKNSISGNDIKSICTTHEGNLLIGTMGNGLNLYEKATGQFKTIPVGANSSYIYDVDIADDGKVWIASEKGLYNGEGLNEKYKIDKLSLEESEVFDIHIDKDGFVWAATSINGFFILNPKFSAFQRMSFPKENTPENGMIYSITGDADGKLWFYSREKGLINFDKIANTYKAHLVGSEISKTEVDVLYMDSRNILWVGTQKGLYSYDVNTKKLNHVLKNVYVSSILEDAYGLLWIGTFTGLQCIDAVKNSIQVYRYARTNKSTISNDHVYFIYEDNVRSLWVGCFGGGINKFDKKSNNFIRYTNDSADPYSISNYNVTCAGEDAYGNLWLGTRGGGLNIREKQTGLFRKFTTLNGLPSNIVNSIQRDDSGNLWFSTNKGLSVVEKSKEITFHNFDLSDGLRSYEFHERSSYKGNDGWLYFGGSKGLDFFHPDSIRFRTDVLPVVISKLRVVDKDFVSDTVINFKKIVELKYSENFVTLDFSVLGVSFPEKHKYMYLMQGVDKNWITTDKEQPVTYANLAPGKYVFKVKASNNFGIWRSEPTLFTIIIKPPFWRTWWFYLLSIICVVSSIVLVIKQREKKIIREKEVAQFKLHALRSQMNPHFIFNSLNSIQHFIIKNESSFALSYLSKFSKLVRRILESSTATRITLSDEMSFLKQYIEIESLRFDNGLEYKFEVDPSIDIHNIEIPSMLIQPYVENSIIHGFMNKKEKGILKIEFVQDKGILKCVVEDNGVGRERSGQANNQNISGHKSLGISITKSRLQILNESDEFNVSVEIIDLFHPNGNAAGTRVEIFIPIN